MRLAIAALLLWTATLHAGNFTEAGRNYFTDVVLTDQNGKEVRFYSDLIEGKIVIINSFFATCPGSSVSHRR